MDNLLVSKVNTKYSFMKKNYANLTSEERLQPKKETIAMLLFYSKMLRSLKQKHNSLTVNKQFYN